MIAQQQSVLIVDDKRANLMALEQILDDIGVSTVKADNGNSALAATLDQEFALCILDVQMPDMDGYELAEILHTDRKTQFLPIIFVTAIFSEHEQKRRGYQVGAVDYVVKPYDPFVLQAKVNIFLQLDRQRRVLLAQQRQLENLNDRLQTEIHDREDKDRLIAQQAKAIEIGQFEKMIMLGRLAASVTHELNQPLNAVRLICGDIRRDARLNRYDVAGLEDAMTKVCDQTARMAEIVDHMRLYSRRIGKPEFVRINAGQPVKGALDLMNNQLKLQGVEIHLDLPEGLSVVGDQLRLEQVFMNLLSNAGDAVRNNSEERGQRVEVAASQSVSPANGRQQVSYTVRDNGNGISREIQDTLFDPFTTTKARGQGTGLGLSVTKAIIDEHGGAIEVDSLSGEGTTFTVLLPASA